MYIYWFSGFDTLQYSIFRFRKTFEFQKFYFICPSRSKRCTEGPVWLALYWCAIYPYFYTSSLYIGTYMWYRKVLLCGHMDMKLSCVVVKVCNLDSPQKLFKGDLTWLWKLKLVWNNYKRILIVLKKLVTNCFKIFDNMCVLASVYLFLFEMTHSLSAEQFSVEHTHTHTQREKVQRKKSWESISAIQ